MKLEKIESMNLKWVEFENRHGRRKLEQGKSRVRMQLEVELKTEVAYDVAF